MYSKIKRKNNYSSKENDGEKDTSEEQRKGKIHMEKKPRVVIDIEERPKF